MAGKQAKVLTQAQVATVLTYLTTTRHSARDRAMFLLSLKSGLRACEIAGLNWNMVTTAEGTVGEVISLEDRISKKGSGRTIPLNRELRLALVELHAARKPKPEAPVVFSERGVRLSPNTVAQWFHHLYRRLGFDGCSSHSGRRSFVTAAARKIGMVGGSLRDVQQLAGHRSLQMTASYVDGDTEAKRKLVNLI